MTPSLFLAPLTSLLLVSMAGSGARPEETDIWPQFRGLRSDGVASQSGLPDRWDGERNVTWRVPIDGRGWSSPIVWGDVVFITSVVSDQDIELPRNGLYGGDRSKPFSFELSWVVMALDLESGDVLWEEVAHRGLAAQPIHKKNTYASETPVTDGESLFAYFGNTGLFAYDLGGDLLWERRWDPVEIRAGWGTSASPILVDDMLVVVNDNEGQSFIEALNKTTGETLWKVDRDERSNFSTPFLWHHENGKEIVTAGSGGVASYSLQGEPLWSLKGMSSITIATPYVSEELLYVSSGFVMDRLRPIHAIRPGGRGELSTEGEHVAWSLDTGAPYNPSTLVYQGLLYVLLDSGFLACYDAKTGEEVYEKQRLGAGLSFTTSPWAYDGKVFCQSEDGETFVVKAGPSFEVLHTNRLDEMAMATPAMVGSSLLIRTIEALYRID